MSDSDSDDGGESIGGALGSGGPPVVGRRYSHYGLIQTESPKMKLNALIDLIETTIASRCRNDKDILRSQVQAFKKFDRSGNGLMCEEELQYTIRSWCGIKMTPEQTSLLFERLDKNDNGSIDAQEFIEGIHPHRSLSHPKGTHPEHHAIAMEQEVEAKEQTHNSFYGLDEKGQKTNDRRSSHSLVKHETSNMSMEQIKEIIKEKLLARSRNDKDVLRANKVL